MVSTSRTARIAKWSSIPAGLVLSGLLVWQASYAAFSDTTDNSGNNWQAGKVELSDDDAGAAMFTATDMAPGDTGTNTIVTTYSGTLDAEIKLYGSNSASAKALAEHIHLEITSTPGTVAAAASAPVFDGTLAEFAGTYTDYAHGLELGQTSGGGEESTTYEFAYTFSPDAQNSAQGGSAQIDFTWEAQSLTD